MLEQQQVLANLEQWRLQDMKTPADSPSTMAKLAALKILLEEGGDLALKI